MYLDWKPDIDKVATYCVSANVPKSIEGNHFGAMFLLKMIKIPLKMVPFYWFREITAVTIFPFVFVQKPFKGENGKGAFP